MSRLARSSNARTRYRHGSGSEPIVPLTAPTDLSNLAYWFDASDVASITESAGAISQWNDKSGNGYHVTQGTAGAKPTTGAATVNGLNVVRFDGGDVLSRSGISLTLATHTVLMVIRENSAVNFSGILSLNHGSGSDHQTGIVCNTDDHTNGFFMAERYHTINLDGASRLSGVGATPLGIYVGTFASGGQVRAIRSAGSTTTTQAAAFGAATGLLFGGRYLSGAIAATNRFNGDIAEIFGYSTEKTNGEINNAAAYLAAKWAQAWVGI